jgi:hypothetical protein
VNAVKGIFFEREERRENRREREERENRPVSYLALPCVCFPTVSTFSSRAPHTKELTTHNSKRKSSLIVERDLKKKKYLSHIIPFIIPWIFG